MPLKYKFTRLNPYMLPTMYVLFETPCFCDWTVEFPWAQGPCRSTFYGYLITNLIIRQCDFDLVVLIVLPTRFAFERRTPKLAQLTTVGVQPFLFCRWVSQCITRWSLRCFPASLKTLNVIVIGLPSIYHRHFLSFIVCEAVSDFPQRR